MKEKKLTNEIHLESEALSCELKVRQEKTLRQSKGEESSNSLDLFAFLRCIEKRK